MPNTPYKITMEDGFEIVGKTDEHGLTKKATASSALIATITVPYYDDHTDQDANEVDSDCGCCSC